MKKISSIVLILAMLLNLGGFSAFAEDATYVAKVGDVECEDAAAMISALNSASGNVTVEIYGKIKTSGFGLNNSDITKLSFVGKGTNAEICVDGVSYIDFRNTDYPIEYTDLILSHINGGENIDGFLPAYFSTYNGGNVTYTNCSFPNGVCACGSVADTTITFDNCTFNNITSGMYSMWIYGNSTNVVVKGGTFCGVRGIKLYSEGSNDFSSLTVSGATFSDTITEKHAVVLTKGESVTLTGNTFNNAKGIVEVDDEYASSIDGKTVTIDGTEYIVDSKNLTLEESTPVETTVAIVNGKAYTDIQEAIIAAAPSGTVEIQSDITVDKWIMISQRLSIGSGQIITLDEINGLTIDGNDHTLTVNSIESASNGNRLFYDATSLNIKDLTIKYADGVVGGIGLTSGVIENVTFEGGVGVLPGTGNITITGCTFKTSGSAIYNEEDRDNLNVTGNHFETTEGQYAIYLRGNTAFTDNTVVTGKVNVTNSATGVISGNNFGNERFKVYNGATASISKNTINNLVFNDESKVNSTFDENILSADAEKVLKAAGVISEPVLSGTGTKEDPYLIGTLDELKWFRDSVNTYTSDGSNQYKGKYVKLTADIDLYEEDENGDQISWEPIGDNDVNDHESFKGIFDGDGHTVKNLYVNAAGGHLGFFARVGDYAEGTTPTVKNINFENVDISAEITNHWTADHGDYVGVIANAGGNSVVENINITGNVYIVGCGYVGGVVGHGYPDLTNCHVKAEEGSYLHAGYWCAGGIIGYAGEGGTPITNCSVSGLEIWSAYGAAAAVAGLLQDGNILTDVYAENVEITSNSDYCMGYIAGNGEASTLTNVSATNVTVTANGNAITATDVIATVDGTYFFDLQSALNAAAAGKGNVTVDILKDIDLTNVEWNPVTISAPGYPLVTVNGNNKTITGLKDMLFAGTWAGKSGLIINDLTIENAYIVNDAEDKKENVGVGAFIGYPQASATITLNNCHLVKSHVEGGHWTGGLIGMAGGYNGDDGPVFMNLTIEKCSVTDSNITGKGSVGGIIGHGSCAAWTNVEIKDTTVFGNTIKSTGSKDDKAGIVMGTIGAAGTAQTVNGITYTGGVKVSVIESGNKATSNGTTIKTVYGRQGTPTGVLTITGGTYENNPIEDNVAYAAPVEGFEIVQNTDGTYGIKEIEEQANLNTRIYFLHRDATETSPIDGNQAYRTRVYAGVDSLKYKSVGFEYRLLNTELPQLETNTDTVYRKLTVTVGGVATPLTPEMFKASEDGADLSHIFALNIFVPEVYGGYRLEVRAYAEREDETKIYTEWYKAPYNSNGTAVK